MSWRPFLPFAFATFALAAPASAQTNVDFESTTRDIGQVDSLPVSSQYACTTCPEGVRFVLDTDGDFKVPDPDSDERIRKTVLVYSAGPDGDPKTFKDNITSGK